MCLLLKHRSGLAMLYLVYVYIEKMKQRRRHTWSAVRRELGQMWALSSLRRRSLHGEWVGQPLMVEVCPSGFRVMQGEAQSALRPPCGR